MKADEEDAQVRAKMQQLGRYVDRELPYGWGWIVLAFPFGSGGRMNYVSNAKRPDVVRAMYEFIAATKASWGKQDPDFEAGTHAGDELIGRLRQEVAALEEQVRQLKKA